MGSHLSPDIRLSRYRAPSHFPFLLHSPSLPTKPYPGRRPDPLSPCQVFDFDHLSRHQSVVTQAELVAAGWDSALDAVLYFHEDFVSQVGGEEGLLVQAGRGQGARGQG